MVEVYEENPDSHRYIGKGKISCTSAGSSDKILKTVDLGVYYLQNLSILFLIGRNLINIHSDVLASAIQCSPAKDIYDSWGNIFIYTKSNSNGIAYIGKQHGTD